MGMSERQVQYAIVQYARHLGWRVKHTRDERRSDERRPDPGWPDLRLLSPRAPDGTRRLLWCKLQRQDGRLTTDQTAVLAALREAGQTVYVWRPRDWLDGTIERVLRAVLAAQPPALPAQEAA